jgi:uncharacterized protein YcnI
VIVPSARARLLVGAATAAAGLVLPAAAWAHATISPPVAEKNALQQFTLSVPTEKENAATTKVTLTVPSGFAIDSFEPEPGWKRTAQTTGSGEEAVVQSVTWSGGSVPTGEDAVFRFNADSTSSKSYTFSVRQTYSDGTVVDWTGPESSDTPAPVVDFKSLGGGGGSSLLALVALVVAIVAVVLAAVGLLTGSRALT